MARQFTSMSTRSLSAKGGLASIRESLPSPLPARPDPHRLRHQGPKKQSLLLLSHFQLNPRPQPSLPPLLQRNQNPALLVYPGHSHFYLPTYALPPRHISPPALPVLDSSPRPPRRTPRGVVELGLVEVEKGTREKSIMKITTLGRLLTLGK